MFSSLFPVYYLRVSPHRIAIRNVRTGENLSDKPEVAVLRGPPMKVLAFGAKTVQARLQPGVEVINPFAHPRSLMSDFTVGQQLFKLFIKTMHGHQWWHWFLPAPPVLLHLQGNAEGGYTQVEIRAFKEMALGAGANDVILWEGAELTDEQILAKSYSPDGVLLG
jgi:rod shape-determining protein MreB and related proteins